VAAFLSVSTTSVHNWTRNGQLPANKVGGKWLYRQADLRHYLRLSYQGPDRLRPLSPKEGEPLGPPLLTARQVRDRLGLEAHQLRWLLDSRQLAAYLLPPGFRFEPLEVLTFRQHRRVRDLAVHNPAVSALQERLDHGPVDVARGDDLALVARALLAVANTARLQWEAVTAVTLASIGLAYAVATLDGSPVVSVAGGASDDLGLQRPRANQRVLLVDALPDGGTATRAVVDRYRRRPAAVAGIATITYPSEYPTWFEERGLVVIAAAPPPGVPGRRPARTGRLAGPVDPPAESPVV
jgi:hypothetical protein